MLMVITDNVDDHCNFNNDVTIMIVIFLILDLHTGHVGGEAQKSVLSILLWAPDVVGELHCLVTPGILVASQEYMLTIFYFCFFQTT